MAVLALNRPHALNALNGVLLRSLGEELQRLDRDPAVGCIVVTGNGKAFAAGADIKEMQNKSYADMLQEDWIAPLDVFLRIKTPTIAAVNGFALGGGCELAMCCDIILASEKAVFGQPEIKIGAIPGAGGTQRLTRAVGKFKAMDLVLTGRQISAAEAEKMGLCSRVIKHENLMEEALKTAKTIASFSRPVTALCKQAVLASQETPLTEGIRAERRMFHSVFALNDQKEGMRAFAEKRTPSFSHS